MSEQYEFNLPKGEAEKHAGMEAARITRAMLLDEARLIALEIAIQRGEVTADDVHRVLGQRGYPADALGNAAGSLFRGKGWEFTGRWRKSHRVSNHGRVIRVWRRTIP